MTEITCVFRKGKGSREHNLREHIYSNKDIDVSRIKDNIIITDCTIEKAYDDLFEKAKTDYNERQKRKDRCIQNTYLDKIKNEKDKNGHFREPFQEIIFEYYDSSNTLSREEQEEMLLETQQKYIEQFPNHKVFSSVLHKDESGFFHIHCDYIPVAYENKTGLSVQMSPNKALSEMGYINTDFRSQFEEYRLDVMQIYDEVLDNHDYIRKEGLKEDRKYLTPNEFKEACNHMRNELREQEFESTYFLIGMTDFFQKHPKLNKIAKFLENNFDKLVEHGKHVFNTEENELLRVNDSNANDNAVTYKLNNQINEIDCYLDDNELEL